MSGPAGARQRVATCYGSRRGRPASARCPSCLAPIKAGLGAKHTPSPRQKQACSHRACQAVGQGMQGARASK